MKRLNLGCGRQIKKGFVNLDFIRGEGVDVVHDLNKFPYPFRDDDFDYVYADNVLEHLADVPRAMMELHRILKPSGILRVIVPHFTAAGAFHDPTHKNFFGSRTFDYFCGYSFYFDFSFKVVSKKIVFGKKFAVWNYLFEPLANIFPYAYEDTPLRVFPAQSLDVTLRKGTG